MGLLTVDDGPVSQTVPFVRLGNTVTLDAPLCCHTRIDNWSVDRGVINRHGDYEITPWTTPEWLEYRAKLLSANTRWHRILRRLFGKPGPSRITRDSGGTQDETSDRRIWAWLVAHHIAKRDPGSPAYVRMSKLTIVCATGVALTINRATAEVDDIRIFAVPEDETDGR